MNKINSILFKLALIIVIIASLNFLYNEWFTTAEPVARNVQCFNMSALNGEKLNTSLLNNTTR